MRAVVQRVQHAKVTVSNDVTGQIDSGLVVLIGVGSGDTEIDAKYVAEKVANLRIFEDLQSKMNLNVQDVGGSVLAVSQFTLYGDCRKGRRPSFVQAELPEKANALFEHYVKLTRDMGVRVETGIFRAHMEVSLVNDGPVTILVDSKKVF